MKSLKKQLSAVVLSAAAFTANAAEHDHHNHHAHHSGGAEAIEVLKKSPIQDASLAGLINDDGKLVQDTDFEGKGRAIFFGFTHCPSVCPMGMTNLSQAIRKLEEKHGEQALDNTEFVLVSTDPERDSPARMKEWLDHFDDRIIGLSGDPDLLEKKAENYRANKMGHHSPYLYLLDKEGEYKALVNTQKGVDEIVEAIETHLLKDPAMEHDHHHHHGM